VLDKGEREGVARNCPVFWNGAVVGRATRSIVIDAAARQ